MDKERAIYLLNRYHSGVSTPEERAEFVLLLHHPNFEKLRNDIMDVEWPEEDDLAVDQLSLEVSDRILAVIKRTPRHSPVRKLRQWLPYAAAIVLLATIGAWFYFVSDPVADSQELVDVRDVAPGGNRAMLTLADGRQIELSETHDGIIIGDGIAYLDGTPIIDDVDGAAALPETIHYEISTPKGGTYQVTLPDGTKVWLNAGTLLRYPSRFEKEQRVIELSGEAYFDVQPLRLQNDSNEKVPFLVVTEGQTVEVLGTQFNLSAYPENADVRTTLVKGSVRVVSATDAYTPVILEPGQQSVVTEGKMVVKTVEVESFIAWKDGYFDFLYTPFSEVIAQIARWYDVEVVYKGDIPEDTFSGRMSRAVTLHGVLQFFEGSKITITQRGDTLIIE